MQASPAWNMFVVSLASSNQSVYGLWLRVFRSVAVIMILWMSQGEVPTLVGVGGLEGVAVIFRSARVCSG